jgi:D-beta-D-heptose 7-phosphate kinase/D-beta-D-heptose 1-phosphate adenosyltransferase
MRKPEIIMTKIFKLDELVTKVAQLRFLSNTIGFTNGIFDIIHQGHVFSLSQAAKEADFLIVGLNSDASTKRLKGNSRPVNDEQSRAIVLASMLMVDAVVIFEEDTPIEVIKAILPDVLIKGGDYTVEQIAGAKEVIANGGRVVINPIKEGFSTSSIIQRINSQ